MHAATETEGCLGPAGAGAATSHLQHRERTQTKQTNSNKHPGCHSAQTLWMLKKNATLAKKKKVCKLLFKKKCVQMLFLFFSCKILRFIVIYKCKLWYQLTFL